MRTANLARWPSGADVDFDRAVDLHKNLPRHKQLGWVMRQPAITTVIIGARSVDELETNVGVLNLDLPDDVWAELDRATTPSPTYPTDFYDRLERRSELH